MTELVKCESELRERKRTIAKAINCEASSYYMMVLLKCERELYDRKRMIVKASNCESNSLR